MYKLLIIDDELNIREGIKIIINWQQYGFTICGEAVNGMEGYEKVLQLLPDLCIVDIKMPAIDGLQMIGMLHEQGFSKTKFIILSGYKEFEYAKLAIRYGVTDYLLKPVDEEILGEIARKIKEQLDKELQYMKRYDDCVGLSRDKVLARDIVLNEGSIDMDELNELYGLGLPWNSYQIALMQFCDNKWKDIEQKEKIFKYVQSTLKAEENYGEAFFINNNIAVLFRNVYFKKAYEILHQLCDTITSRYDAAAYVALGSKTRDIKYVMRSFQQAQNALDQKFFTQNNVIILPTDKCILKENTGEKTEFSVEDYIQSVYIAIETNNKQRLREIMNRLTEDMKHKEISSDESIVSFISLYITITGQILKDYRGEKVSRFLNESIYRKIYASTSVFELSNFVMKQFERLADSTNYAKADGIMAQLTDFIDRNYDKDLKLEELGSTFGYNSAYLGKMFRNHTGEYFNGYLDRIRIEKAMELLKDTSLKVHEIAEQVGYRKYDYFCVKFKKYSGVSPLEYRKKTVV